MKSSIRSRRRLLVPPKRYYCIVALGITGALLTAAFSLNASGASQIDTHENRKVLFECSDGRLGLHVVHTRFLIGQSKTTTAVFKASRLLLLKSFLIPNLNAQTSQSFLLYTAYDPHLSPSVVLSLQETLGGANQHTLIATDTNTTNPSIDLEKIIKQVANIDPRVHDISITVTSRIDLDDLAHIGAVEAIQNTACHTSTNNINNYNKKKNATDMALTTKLVYIHKGMLWYPSAQDTYGQTCVWKNAFNSHLAILQSMITAARPDAVSRKLLKSLPLNVYSYPHYKPSELQRIIDENKNVGSHRMSFNATVDVVRWRTPDVGDVGCLYSKTASSWSWGKLQHKGIECAPADPARLFKLFGLTRQRAAAINAFFAGLEQDAASLVANSTKEHLEYDSCA